MRRPPDGDAAPASQSGPCATSSSIAAGSSVVRIEVASVRRGPHSRRLLPGRGRGPVGPVRRGPGASPAARPRALRGHRRARRNRGRESSSSPTERWAARSGSGGSSGTSATTPARCWTAASTRGSAHWSRERRPSSRRSSRRGSVAATRSTRRSSHAGSTIRAWSWSTRGSRLRWRGEENPIDKVPGRIPGALNAPWNEPLPELPEGDLVAYCGSGVTSSVTVHRLALAGRDARLYPGSWSQWETLDLPVERS